MSLSGISSNFEPDKDLKQVENKEKDSPQKPDGKSIFAEFHENGNKTVDVEDVVCAEGTTLSNKIMKFLTENNGKQWTSKLTFTLNSLISEFNYEKFKEKTENDFKVFEENALNEMEAKIKREKERLKSEPARKKLNNNMKEQSPQFVLMSDEDIPVKGVDREQPVYREDDEFAAKMSEPWVSYDVQPAEEMPAKGVDKEQPVYREDDEEESLTLYEPEMTPPPIGKKPEIQPGANAQNNKQPVDKSKPGAKWSEASTVSGSGYYSKETAKFERLNDMTIRKTEVGFSNATGAVVLNSIYQEDGKTPITRNYVTNLGGTGVVATANYDENGKKISDTYNLDSMKETINSKAMILTSAMSRLKEGSMELQDKNGNVILTVKDGQALNSKGKPIHKDLYDFIEKYDNTEGLKLVKRY